MFTSGSNQNPFTYSKETLFEQCYNYDIQNPNLTQEDEPPFMLNFPTPFLDDHELNLSHILHQEQPMPIHGDVVVDQNEKSKNKSINKGENTSIEIAKEAPMESKPARRRNHGTTSQKRTGKKDRHIKICTAQGVRDRRMRLSLQIARKFFDLQDMLGFDKASNTIDWLFSKSNKAIKELSMNLPKPMTNSSICEEKSESEVVASAVEENMNNEAKNKMVAAEDVTFVENPNVKINSNLRNVVYNHHHARESREKARARARERTREKLMIKHIAKTNHWCELNSHNSDQLKSCNPFETLEESTSHETSSFHQFANPMFSYQNNVEISLGVDSNTTSFMGLLGNWETNRTRINSINGAGNSTSSNCFATSNFPVLLQYREIKKHNGPAKFQDNFRYV